MAELFTTPFTFTTTGYTAGSGSLAVSSAAPAAIQGGTFSVRLGNASNTVLKVTGGASTTTWTVVAEYNDANAAASTNVYGCELSPRALAALLQQNATTYAADSGTANTYAATLAPAPTLAAGSSILLKVANANTGASTLALNGGTANPIKKNATTALASGDLVAGQIYLLLWDAANSAWQLVGGGGGTSSGGSGGGVNAQTASYTAVSGDSGKLISFNSASAITLTLPSAPPSSSWWVAVENIGTGTLTISRNGLNIDGSATNLTLTQNQGLLLFTDGSNYFTQRTSSIAGAQPLTATQSGQLAASRAIGTVYQNTTGYPLFVEAALIFPSGYSSTRVLCDASSTPTTYLASASGSSGSAQSIGVSFVVPAGYYYKVFGFNGTPTGIDTWIETTLSGMGAVQTSVTTVPITAAQSDVTGSRVVGTVYQNTTGYPILVTSSFTTNATSDAFYATIGPTSTPTLQVASVHAFASCSGCENGVPSFIVPAGYYYKVTHVSGTPGVIQWIETQLQGTSGTTAQAIGGSGVLVSEFVCTSAQGSVTFASLPTNYRDLRIVVRGRGDAAATTTSLLLQVNGDSGANYDWAVDEGTASATVGAASVAQTSAVIGWLPGGTSPASAGGATDITIPNFAGTTFQKSFRGNTGVKQGTTSNSIITAQFSGFWRNTAAITSITVSPDAGNFAAGSIISLYADGPITPLAVANAGAGALVPLGMFDATGLSAVQAATRNVSGQSGAMLQADFDEYVVEVVGFNVGTNSALALLQFSTNGGTSYLTTNYSWSQNNSGIGTSSGGTNGSASMAGISLFSDASTGGLSSSANPALCMQLRVYLANKPLVSGAGVASYGPSGNLYQFAMGGLYTSAITPNALQIAASAGTFTAGSLRVYGVSKAPVSGPNVNAIATKTGAYTAQSTDATLLANASGGAFTLTLPVSPYSGQILIVKKTDASANAVTISGNGKTIDGSSSVSIATQYQSLTLQYDPTSSGWIVI